jgi:O-antigen ligase
LYLTFCSIFIFTQIQLGHFSRNGRLLLWLLAIFFSLFVTCLSSKIMICSMLILALLFATRELLYKQNKTQGIIVSALALILIVALYLNPISRFRNIQEVATTSLHIDEHKEYKSSIEIRLSLWWLAVKSVNANNFLMGLGTGDVAAAMSESSRRYSVTNSLHSYDPHNQFLFTLLAQGIIGLTILILNFVAPVYVSLLHKDYLYLAFAFLCASICLTESAFELQKGIVFFSLISPLLLLRTNAFMCLKFFSSTIDHA